MQSDPASVLPRPLPNLLITPFDEEGEGARFLIEVANGSFVVNRRMRFLIEALVQHSSMASFKLHLENSLGETVSEDEVSATIARLPQSLFEDAANEPKKSPFHFSCQLLSAKTVQQIAHTMRLLYTPSVMAMIVVVFLLELPWLIQGLPRGLDFNLLPADLPLFVLGMCAAALLHETGHAAACVWSGVRPGEIGFGLYLIFPAFYADVTKAWRLSRNRRALVDLGGIYFQLILITALIPVAHFSENADWLFSFIIYNFYVIFHNLNPIFKMDGYWLFSDLAGVPNLHRRTWSVFRHIVLGQNVSIPNSFWGEARRPLIYGYAFAILSYAAFIIATLPRWCAVQLTPYPAIAVAHFHSIVNAYTDANYFDMSLAISSLACASFMPILICTLPVLWILKGSKFLLSLKTT